MLKGAEQKLRNIPSTSTEDGRALESLGGVERFSCYRYFESYDMWDVNVVYKADSYLDRTERAFIDLMKTTFSQSP